MCIRDRGEAAAILNVQQATADGIRMVREAGADNAVLTLQAVSYTHLDVYKRQRARSARCG